MKNIGDALKEPAQSLAESAAKLNAPESKQLANQADVLVRLSRMESSHEHACGR